MKDLNVIGIDLANSNDHSVIISGKSNGQVIIIDDIYDVPVTRFLEGQNVILTEPDKEKVYEYIEREIIHSNSFGLFGSLAASALLLGSMRSYNYDLPKRTWVISPKALKAKEAVKARRAKDKVNRKRNRSHD